MSKDAMNQHKAMAMTGKAECCKPAKMACGGQVKKPAKMACGGQMKKGGKK